jgi:F-type H+-transporting ATPase subunit alpha
VGSAAQTKAIKKVSGQLRMTLAQYRELAVFSQFSSDLDASAKALLSQGEKLTETLKQDQFSPLSVSHQVIMLHVVSKKHLINLPTKFVKPFLIRFIEFMETNEPDLMRTIQERGDFTDDIAAKADENVERFKKVFYKENNIEENK